MQQNRKPRNKPIHIQSINLWQRSQTRQREKTISSINHVGKLDSHIQKNETEPKS